MNVVEELTTNPDSALGSNFSADAVLEQCARVTESEEFRTASLQQRLLRHLVTETLAKRGAELKEYSIGLEVFHRSPDFDPRIDAVVRVSAGQLRRRLASYYTTVGSQDEIIISIPKGHYWAEFNQVARKEPAQLPAEVAQISEAQEGAPDRMQHAVANLGPKQKWVISWWLLLVVGLMVAPSSFWLGFHRGNTRQGLSGNENIGKSFFWSIFLRGDPHATAVIGTATTAAIGSVVVRVPSVNDDVEIKTNPEMQMISRLFAQPPRPYSVYTGIGDAIAAARLEHACVESSIDLSILSSPEVRFRDLHSQNVIFISSLRFRDLHSSLSDKRDFDTQDMGDERIRIVNRAPRKGELLFYDPSGNYADPSIDYALISILPSTENGHQIMEVGGTGTLGTAGAAQYITEAASLSELDAHLKKDRPTNASSVQVLLRVNIMEHQVVSVHYVAHHWIV